MWYETFGPGFFLAVGGIIATIGGLIIKSCYKSKCKDFICCYGMLKIKRDTDIEEQIDNRINRSDTIPNEI
jgi:hypothetical protein